MELLQDREYLTFLRPGEASPGFALVPRRRDSQSLMNKMIRCCGGNGYEQTNEAEENT